MKAFIHVNTVLLMASHANVISDDGNKVIPFLCHQLHEIVVSFPK